MIHDIDWTKCHNGLMLCKRRQVDELMPEVVPILDDLAPYAPQYEFDFWTDKVIDVKVHMLMPGQWPCIPNWHRDFNPRDGLDLVEGWKPPENDPLMFMWLSGPPLTEYLLPSGEVIQKPPQKWHAFGRGDTHRGVQAEEFTWRCFIRVIPQSFVHSHQINDGQIRRHSQVYLSDKFRW